MVQIPLYCSNAASRFFCETNTFPIACINKRCIEYTATTTPKTFAKHVKVKWKIGPANSSTAKATVPIRNKCEQISLPHSRAWEAYTRSEWLNTLRSPTHTLTCGEGLTTSRNNKANNTHATHGAEYNEDM